MKVRWCWDGLCGARGASVLESALNLLKTGPSGQRLTLRLGSACGNEVHDIFIENHKCAKHRLPFPSDGSSVHFGGRRTLTSHLGARAWFALAILVAAMGLLLFVSAGTLHYWQAWVYLFIFGSASAFTTLFLLRTDSALLERRMRGGPTAEGRPVQKLIMSGTSIGFVALHVVPALDHRFDWSAVPLGGVVAGDALVAIGFYLIFLVYRENTFTSATIEVAENQKVVSTGPYAIVRHPMYAGGLLYLLGIPLALASYWGFVVLAGTAPFLIWRLFDEEGFLAANLPGYAEYQKRVRHRLVPFVW